jgi:hypothetical protein
LFLKKILEKNIYFVGMSLKLPPIHLGRHHFDRSIKTTPVVVVVDVVVDVVVVTTENICSTNYSSFY